MYRAVEKKAFLFYATTLDLLEELKPERQGKVAMALIEYGSDKNCYFVEFSGALSVLNKEERVLFRSAIYEITVQKRRYHNKQMIRGAIGSVQASLKNITDEKQRNACIDTIRVLEDKYQYVTKHDELNVARDLLSLLPDESCILIESVK